MTDLWTDPSSLGDPEAMRSLARQMRALARDMSSRMEDLQRRTEETTFEGPAALRLSENGVRRRRQVEGVVDRLFASSKSLLSAASQVEDDIADLRRRQREARAAESREMWT